MLRVYVADVLLLVHRFAMLLLWFLAFNFKYLFLQPILVMDIKLQM